MASEAWFLVGVVLLFWSASFGGMLWFAGESAPAVAEWYPRVARPTTLTGWASSALAFSIGRPLTLLLLGPPVLGVLVYNRVRVSVRSRRDTRRR